MKNLWNWIRPADNQESEQGEAPRYSARVELQREIDGTDNYHEEASFNWPDQEPADS